MKYKDGRGGVAASELPRVVNDEAWHDLAE
jgi:hypothetical protein